MITHSSATVEKADTSAATTEGDSVNNKCEMLCVRDWSDAVVIARDGLWPFFSRELFSQ